MKKITTIFVLLFVLTVSAFAEGEYPTGGKTCPQGQTCSTGEYPTGGLSQTVKDVFDYLTSIFD